MSDIVSALPGRTASGFVEVEEAGLRGMVTIRGDLTSAPFRKAVKSETGAAVPDPCMRSTIGDNGLLWMSPDELLLTCPYDAGPVMVEKLEKALDGQHSLVVNVSDARAMFFVSGAPGDVRDALAKLTPADLSPMALPVGNVSRTRFAQVPAALWFEEDGKAAVVCFRSVAQYVFDLLKASGRQGSEVSFHAL